MDHQRMELLAPAGSFDTLKAVIAAGADAVYVGGGMFGARAYAKNFTQEELLDAIDYVHLYDRKLHLTINTLLKNKEIEQQLYDYFLPYYERGIDAVIVQDMGVFSFLKKYFPDVELHASTQMTIASEMGAKFWEEAGADRVVLSRELSVSEIAQIHRAVDVELEAFVHGALCYCYSGQCLFSSMLGGRSGNRGRCAGPCRLSYQLQEQKSTGELYPLSPKDLCGIDFLPALKEAGVASLKIEGRMKQTAYAAGVVSIYRKYLDLLELSDEPYAVDQKDAKKLLDLGNRSGFTSGYLQGNTGKAMMSLNTPAHESAKLDEELPVQEKRKLEGICRLMIHEPARIVVKDPQTGIEVSVVAGEVQTARKAPLEKEKVLQVLGQTGETAFTFERLELQMDENCFVPNQFLKALRRESLEKIRQEILSSDHRTAQAYDHPITEPDRRACATDQSEIAVSVETLPQLRIACAKEYVSDIILNCHEFDDDAIEKELTEQIRQVKECNKNVYLQLPSVLRQYRVKILKNHWAFLKSLFESGMLDGFYVKTYDSLGFLRKMNVNPAKIRLDASIYSFSNDSVRAFSDMGYDKLTLPLELNAKELSHHSNENSEMVIYGYTPYMVSALCLNKNMDGCDHTRKALHLLDRYGKSLTMKNYCSECYNILYNASPTVLFDELDQICDKLRPERLRISFSIEEEREVQAVFANYERAIEGLPMNWEREITKGHLKRGVE